MSLIMKAVKWVLVLIIGFALGVPFSAHIQPYYYVLLNRVRGIERPAIKTEGMTVKSFSQHMENRLAYFITYTEKAAILRFEPAQYQGGRTWLQVAKNALELNAHKLRYDIDHSTRRLLICGKDEPCKLPRVEP